MSNRKWGDPMDRSESFDFIENYLSWIRSNSSQKRIGDYEEITTPFVDSHNDQIQFYICRSQNGFTLTDDGYTMSDLEMCGCDIKSKKRKEFILQIAESLGVSIKGGSIVAEATEADIACKQHMMIQAMLKISDMFLTTSSRVKSLFFEEVDSFFTENDIRNTPSIMMMGQSGLSHRFDFVIPASKKMPERIVTTLNTPNKQNVQTAIFAWNDVIKTRSAHSKGYIILNDSKRPPNLEILTAIKNYDLIPLQWKERQNFVSELAS